MSIVLLVELAILSRMLGTPAMSALLDLENLGNCCMCMCTSCHRLSHDFMHMSSDAGKRKVYHRGRRHDQSTLSDMIPQAVRSEMSASCCGATNQIPKC